MIATKEGRKKAAELSFARYICAAEIFSRDPSGGLQGSQEEKEFYPNS